MLPRHHPDPRPTKRLLLVGEPVQQRSSQSLRPKHLGPLVEGGVWW